MPVRYTSKLPISLKSEVEQTFGRHIFSAKDCILLSREIFTKTKEQVNVNTLRRLFGLVKTHYNPSASTLNILAKFCGFSSFEEVPEISAEKKEKELVPRQDVIKYLTNVLEEMPLHDVLNPTFCVFYKHLILFLDKNPSLAKAFQSHLVKARNGYAYYFEQFVNIDKLNNFYGDGLRQYANEHRTKEAEVFTSSLLVFRYWLTMEPQKIGKVFASLSDVQLSSSMGKNVFTSSRFFSAQLYNAHVHKLPVEKTINDIQKFHFNLCTQKEQTQLFPFFEYIIAEALILTGYYYEGLYYINYALDNYYKNLGYQGFGYYQALDLLKTIALLKTDQQKEARLIFNEINPSEFGFLSNKYNSILYLMLSKSFKRARQNDKKELNALIKETGFKRIEYII
jgi:hypothetical protein